jgi:Rrf2 family protein
MKITAAEEYGLRCLLQIAREPARFSTIEEIASREGLTPTYTAKLLRIMRKAGLVTAIRGRKGGFRLGQPADQITVGTVLGVLGGQLYQPDFCKLHTGHRRVCVHNADCSIRSLWMAVSALVQEAMQKVTLEDLRCAEEEEMGAWGQRHLTLAPRNRASSFKPCPGTRHVAF